MTKRAFIGAALFLAAFCIAINAQSSNFTFQGKLTDQGAPANGSYLLRFRMFDAPTAGTQIGSTIDDVTVTATDGIFTAQLDFGAPAFTGSDRYLEVAVRRDTGESYVTLTPREQISSSPYSVKAISAGQADSALNSDKLGGLDATQYVQQSDPRLTDARDPLPGSGSYIQNGTAQQTAAFNVSGNGVLGGSLGVGTTVAGGARLSVVGGGFPNNVRIADIDTTGTALELWNASTGGRNWRFQSVGSGVAGRVGNLEIWETSGQSNPAIMFQPNGNIGVGTTAPTQRMQINGGNFLVRGSNNFAAAGDSAFSYLGDSSHYIRAINNSGVRIGTFGVGDGITLLQSTGNVGLGTVAPTAKLHVEGTGDPLIRLNHVGASGSPSLWLQQDGTAKAFIYWNSSINSLSLGTSVTNPVMTLGEGGDVSMTAGTGRLTVRNITATNIGGSGEIQTQLCITTSGSHLVITCSSSLRYKKDVHTFTGGLDIVRRLRPISFAWKTDGQHDVGLGAEEVASVMPALTFSNEKGEVEGVKYNQISAILINAIKEQQEQIDSLRAENLILTDAVRDLQRRSAGSSKVRKRR